MKIRQLAIYSLCLLGMWLGGVLTVQAQTRTMHLYYTDPQGTVLAKTDARGNIIAQYDYTPYGSSVTSLGNPPDGPGYTGHVNDPETGLVYMQSRYYHTSGRFLSPDPVGPSPGNLFSFNRYAYTDNNPVKNVDPDGRSVTCDQDSCTIVAHNRLEEMIGYAYVGGVIIQRAIKNAIAHSSQSQTNGNSPALPGGLVGVQDGKSGLRGKKFNSGPLAPEHGGTNDSEKDFGKLIGGESHPAPIGQYPPGTTIGNNGISHRPATEDSGPRIDIPANGDKPHETLHYPKPSPPPPPPDKDPSRS